MSKNVRVIRTSGIESTANQLETKAGTDLEGPEHAGLVHGMTSAPLTDPYLIGFKEGMEHGYKIGWDASNAQAETQAELAARFFYAMEAGDEIHRKLARSARDAVDVVEAREQMKRGASE